MLELYHKLATQKYLMYPSLCKGFAYKPVSTLLHSNPTRDCRHHCGVCEAKELGGLELLEGSI